MASVEYYNRFLDKLKAIKILCHETDFKEKDKNLIENSFGNILNQIILFKDMECRLKYVISKRSKDDLDSETKDSIEEAQRLLDKGIEEVLKKIGDDKLLKKAYKKINFIIDEDCDEKEDKNGENIETKLNIDDESSGLIKYIIDERDKDLTSKNILHKREIILESLVVSLCTYLEAFVSNITEDFYLNIHKGDLFSEKTIKFEELKEIGSIEEAEVFLIESELQYLFKKGFHTWFNKIDKFFDINKNFKDHNLNNVLNEINELYLRRNLYVHADGKVNSIYLMHAPKEYCQEKTLDEKLRIDKEYIESKICMVEKIGTMMFFSYCLKKYNDKNKMFDDFNSVFINEIANDDNNDIYSITYNKFYKMDGSKLNSMNQMMAKMNYFLAFKLRGDYNLIKEEIKKLDVSAYSDDFKRARNIIMEDEDSIDETIKHFENTEDHVFLFEIQWPLYKIIKGKSTFDNYVNERLSRIFS